MNNILLTLCINTDLTVLLSVTDGLEEKHGTYFYLRPFCFLVESRLLSGGLDATRTYRYVPCNRKGSHFKIPFNAAPSKHQHIKSSFLNQPVTLPSPHLQLKHFFPLGERFFVL